MKAACASGSIWPVAALCVAMLLAASDSRSEVAPPAPNDAIAAIEREISHRMTAITDDASLDAASRDAAGARLKEAQKALQAARSARLERNRLAEERVAAPMLLAGRVAPTDDDMQALAEEWSTFSLPQLEIAVAEADNFTRAAHEQLSGAQQQLADLRNHRPLIGAELASARDAASNAGAEVVRLAAIAQTVQDTDTEQLLARARQQTLEARLALLQEQRDGADTREQLLTAQIAAAEHEATRRDRRLQALRVELSRRRLAAAAADVSAWQSSRVGSHAVIGALARSNRELAELYGGATGVTHQLDQVQRTLVAIERTIARFESDATELRARLEGLGRTFAAGVLIREAIESLPSAVEHQARLEQLRVAINETQLRIATLASELRRLEHDLAGEISVEVAKLRGLPEADEAAAREIVGKLLAARQRIVQPLLRDLDQLLNAQVELQAREKDLLARVQQEKASLRSRGPWVRNGRRVSWHDFPAALDGVAALVDLRVWSNNDAARVLTKTASRGSVAFALAGFFTALATLGVLRHRRRRPARRDEAREKSNPAAGVLLAALLGGLATAALTGTLGWLLRDLPSGSVAVKALGRGLLQLSPGFFLLGFLQAFFAERGGAASANPALAGTAARVRGSLGYLVAAYILIILAGVLALLGAAGEIANGDPAARLCMLLVALLLAGGIHRAMAPRITSGLQAAGLPQSQASIVPYLLSAVMPFAFAVLLLQGFTIAAYDLARTVLGTLLVLVVAGSVRVAFLRPDATAGIHPVQWSPLRQGRLDLLHVLVSIGTILTLLWVWREAFAALGYLQDIPLWSAETVDGLKTVTVMNLLSCLTVLAGTLVVFWALPLVFGVESADPTRATVGTRYAVIALVRYVVLIAGLFSAFSLLNIGWSKLQWMAAGLSVGLGFGLQETVANFFSGLTLLSERSIRVGDMVTVGDKTGIVKRIKVRATTVEDFDGREIVIPNKQLVTTQVTNWTLTDSRRRLQVWVGVPYRSDTDRVVQTLLLAAHEVDGILAEPPPQAVFEQFGKDSLQFRLYVWIAAPQHVVRINHELHMVIERLFRASGITIEAPQQDPHLYPPGRIEVGQGIEAPADPSAADAAS